MNKRDESNLKGLLEVDRQQFNRGLRQARKVKAFEGQAVRLTFDGDTLQFDIGGFQFNVAATGQWEGEVLVPDAFFSRLARVPQKGKGSIPFSTNGEELTIEFVTVGCEWNAFEYPRIELPLSAPLSVILSLPKRYSAVDIERSGLCGRVAEAEQKRDELIAKALEFREEAEALMEKAAAILDSLGCGGDIPIGISKDEFYDVLDEKLKQKSQSDSS